MVYGESENIILWNNPGVKVEADTSDILSLYELGEAVTVPVVIRAEAARAK